MCQSQPLLADTQGGHSSAPWTLLSAPLVHVHMLLPGHPSVCTLQEQRLSAGPEALGGAGRAGKWQVPRAPMEPLSGKDNGWREET